MDPFIQRMQDRARLRREKLDMQQKNINISPTKRIPLKAQEPNQTHTVKITTEEVTISKSRRQAPLPPKAAPSPPPPPAEVVVEDDSVEDEVSIEEEQMSIDEEQISIDSESEHAGNQPAVPSAAIRDDARNRLQRLGDLYSGRPSKLSSPIHKNEERFFCDEDMAAVSRPAARAPARSARLAALANTINQWEDDLSRPNGTEIHVMDVTADDTTSPTKAVLDDKLMTTLERQGYSRSKSNSRLVYDYSSGSPQGSSSQLPGARPSTSAVKEAWLMSSGVAQSSPGNKADSASWLHKASSSTSNLAASKPASNFTSGAPPSIFLPSQSSCSFLPSKSASSLSPSKSTSNFLLRSPEKSPAKQPAMSSPRLGIGNPRPAVASPEKASQLRSVTSVPQMGLKAVSPRKPLENGSPANGSVLHKAQLFEASVSPSKRVDPADLTVAERMALFERNKGEALVPKCAFGLSVHPVPKVFAGGIGKSEVKVTAPKQQGVKIVAPKQQQQQEVRQVTPVSPVKALSVEQNTKKAECVVEAEPSNLVSAQRQMFERGGGRVAHQAIAQAVLSERQKDMDMLLNRWNKRKEDDDDDEMEEKALVAPQKPVACPVPQVSTPPPPPPPLPFMPFASPVAYSSPLQPSAPQRRPSPQKGGAAAGSCATPQFPAVRRIKVSPPKPGKLYPCLSDIETMTETETEGEIGEESGEYNNSSSELESSADAGDTSFGRSILMAVSRHATPAAAKPPAELRRTVSSRSETESEVMETMDDFLEDAMHHRSSGDSSDNSEGPTPPKKTRGKSSKKGDKYRSPTSAPSHSFKYSRGGSDYSSPAGQSQQALPTHVMEEGGEQVPLMHTVSFYRRQQNMGNKTPVRQVTRHPETNMDTAERRDLPTDQDNVRRKIAALLEEVSKQQTVISQASQALNLCSSTVEFSGSAESVEGERLLLLATHRRQAALNEVQRLKVEGSLKPLTEFGRTVELDEKGSLTVRDIMLPLKKDYVRNIARDENVHHFLCLVKSQEQVLATQALTATTDNLRQGVSLAFANALKLSDLYSDFKVLLEVYALQTRKEMLPHEVKYHINKKDAKGRLTPKKKTESRLMMPAFQSPAGPGAVRSPAFQLAGYVVFSLRELQRTHFTLNKVAYTSPLEGQVGLALDSMLCADTTERGFLTMFEDVSGFGAWHRRWCVLKGAALSYWKYPDDEKKKVPIGCIDLASCTTRTVDLVSRDMCARPNTFLLETTRPALADDRDSLVLVRSDTHTTIRHLLSADTREERIVWCSQLNKALTMLRAWNNKRPSE